MPQNTKFFAEGIIRGEGSADKVALLIGGEVQVHLIRRHGTGDGMGRGKTLVANRQLWQEVFTTPSAGKLSEGRTGQKAGESARDH